MLGGRDGSRNIAPRIRRIRIVLAGRNLGVTVLRSKIALTGPGLIRFPLAAEQQRRNSVMANSDTEVVIVGGGAAGIAAGRRLAKAAIKCLVVEARPRLGGRAWTVTDRSGFALDLGCGWLHSADRNPWLKAVSYTHLRAHETRHDLVCRLL